MKCKQKVTYPPAAYYLCQQETHILCKLCRSS